MRLWIAGFCKSGLFVGLGLFILFHPINAYTLPLVTKATAHEHKLGGIAPVINIFICDNSIATICTHFPIYKSLGESYCNWFVGRERSGLTHFNVGSNCWRCIRENRSYPNTKTFGGCSSEVFYINHQIAGAVRLGHSNPCPVFNNKIFLSPLVAFPCQVQCDRISYAVAGIGEHLMYQGIVRNFDLCVGFIKQITSNEQGGGSQNNFQNFIVVFKKAYNTIPKIADIRKYCSGFIHSHGVLAWWVTTIVCWLFLFFGLLFLISAGDPEWGKFLPAVFPLAVIFLYSGIKLIYVSWSIYNSIF